jgi:hypothetical protein
MKLTLKITKRVIQIIACSVMLLNWEMRADIYIPGNIVQNNDFGYWPTGLGPADWTWTVNVGAGGYGGEIYGTVSQELPTIAGQEYILQFAMAGNPNTSASETLNIYWGNDLVGSTTWYPNGQGYQNLGWDEFQFTVEASMSPSLLTFENANSYATGQIPFLNAVGVVPIPEPSTVVLSGLSACILIQWSCRKGRRVF